MQTEKSKDERIKPSILALVFLLSICWLCQLDMLFTAFKLDILALLANSI